MNPIFQKTEKRLTNQALKIVDSDKNRPRGGFFVIDEQDIARFVSLYFDGLSPVQWQTGNKLSPKILLVAPGKRLSWQYHNRRAEIWKVAQGEVGVVVSDNDEETPFKKLKENEL